MPKAMAWLCRVPASQTDLLPPQAPAGVTYRREGDHWDVCLDIPELIEALKRGESPLAPFIPHIPNFPGTTEVEWSIPDAIRASQETRPFLMYDVVSAFRAFSVLDNRPTEAELEALARRGLKTQPFDHQITFVAAARALEASPGSVQWYQPPAIDTEYVKLFAPGARAHEYVHINSRGDVVLPGEELPIEPIPTHVAPIKGGLLCDEPGSGKTLSILSLCALDDEASPSLVVCPPHVVKTWADQSEQHFGTALEVVKIASVHAFKKLRGSIVRRKCVVVCSYNLFNSPSMKALFLLGGSAQTVSATHIAAECADRKRRRVSEDEPLTSFFIPWNRVIFDELHQVFNAPPTWAFVQAIASFARFTWVVSASAIADEDSYWMTRSLLVPRTTPRLADRLVSQTVNRFPLCVYDRIQELQLTKCIFRRPNNVVLPPVHNRVVRVRLSPEERAMYDAAVRLEHKKRICLLPRYWNVADDDRANERAETVEEAVKKTIGAAERDLSALLKRRETETSGLARLDADIATASRRLAFAKSCSLENSDCPVCFEETGDNGIVIFDCAHSLCPSCAGRVGMTCPMCRKVSKSRVRVAPSSSQDDLAKRVGTKVAAIIRIIQEAHASGEKTLVFAADNQMLKELAELLNKEGLETIFCMGSIFQRDANIAKFRARDSAILMLSSLYSATGVGLTEATHVVISDTANAPPPVIAEMEKQAISRAHRLGQTKPVTVHRVIASDTVDEEVLMRCHGHEPWARE